MSQKPGERDHSDPEQRRVVREFRSQRSGADLSLGSPALLAQSWRPSAVKSLKTAIRVLWVIMWPPQAPLGDIPSQSNRTWWTAVCAGTVIPLTATFHYSVFYRHTCMLAQFGQDYTLTVIARWLWLDPSFACALVAMMIVYLIGIRKPWGKALVAPVFSAFLPFSLWIWDIPFSGRYVCRHFHDGRFLLVAGRPLTTTVFCAIGLALYLSFVVGIIRKMKKTS
jgi:hypothetical protein